VPQEKTREARGSPSSKLASCASIRFFLDLEPDALDQLCRLTPEHAVQAGSGLFFQGRSRYHLYAVVSGHGEDERLSADGRSAIFISIVQERLSGKLRARRAGRSTMRPQIRIGESWSWIGREVSPFYAKPPALAMKFIELLCTRLRWTAGSWKQVILQNLPGRLASG